MDQDDDSISPMNETSPFISPNSNLPLSHRDVINHVKLQIKRMRDSGNSLRAPLSAEKITATGENLSIRPNQTTQKFLIQLFPPDSIPQKKQRRSEGERKTYKQKYDPDQVELKRNLLTIALNICWNQALFDELTDELRASLFCPDNGPIDYIIYILCECVKEMEIECWGETIDRIANLNEGVLPDPPNDYYDDVSSVSWDGDSCQHSNEHSSTEMKLHADEISIVDLRIDDIENKVEDLKTVVEGLVATVSSLTISTPVTNVPASQNPSLQDQSLSKRILELLSSGQRLKACHIATKLQCSTADINRILYHELEQHVLQNITDNTWSLLVSTTSPSTLVPTEIVSSPSNPMTLHSDLERFLTENPKSDALTIARALQKEKKEINRTLTSMESMGKVFQSPSESSSSRPLWSLSNKRMREEF
jgi:hypothetical protein